MREQSQNGLEGKQTQSSEFQSETPSRNSEYLRGLADNVRGARARRGMTRKMLARDSGVSERFLAQLESGAGNASILVLRQIANALDLSLEALLPGTERPAGELAQSIELLRRLDPANLAKAHEILLREVGNARRGDRGEHIALIGLRGAGKSTIGKLLAARLEMPFFELDRLVERESGIPLAMIFDMYGQIGFRRFERRCLEDLLGTERRFVLATGGSLVSEAATYDRLLETCYTVWLRATPQEHMSRVIAQGDMRPMAKNPEAMSDLERILAEREQLYRKAAVVIDTSNRSVQEVVDACLESIKGAAGAVSAKNV